MRTVAFVDGAAGVSGDMFLGALVDLGLPLEDLEGVVAALGLHDVAVEARKVRRGPLAATKVNVRIGGRPADAAGQAHGEGGHAHPHRRLGDVLECLRSADGLPPEAVADAVRAFGLLARAEGRVHGEPPEEVVFHEVGAADAMVDVLGTCVGLRRLGVTEVRVGPLPWGGGEIGTQHGPLALPAPAVLHLLEGHPMVPSYEKVEQVTPTGAALVASLARGTTPPAGFRPRSVGVGAGRREEGRLPNVLRLVVGEVGLEEAATECLLLEANLDDVTGQEAARALDLALEEGALDAWAAPVTMKKGRPGLVLSLLVLPGEEDRFEALLFRETPTLGVRRRPVARTVLSRHHEPVQTPWGSVRMKVRQTPDGDEATPEHDDCLRLARTHGVALRRVVEAARRAWRGAEEAGA